MAALLVCILFHSNSVIHFFSLLLLQHPVFCWGHQRSYLQGNPTTIDLVQNAKLETLEVCNGNAETKSSYANSLMRLCPGFERQFS